MKCRLIVEFSLQWYMLYYIFVCSLHSISQIWYHSYSSLQTFKVKGLKSGPFVSVLHAHESFQSNNAFVSNRVIHWPKNSVWRIQYCYNGIQIKYVNCWIFIPMILYMHYHIFVHNSYSVRQLWYHSQRSVQTFKVKRLKSGPSVSDENFQSNNASVAS